MPEYKAIAVEVLYAGKYGGFSLAEVDGVVSSKVIEGLHVNI